MKKFSIAWGPEKRTIYAESKQDVWALFAQGCEAAMRHPHLHEPLIEEVKLPKYASPPASAPAPAAVSVKK